MEWLQNLSEAIDYIERNLEGEISASYFRQCDNVWKRCL